jgi:hypothetical protein
MQFINENYQQPGNGRVDVPLSVWPVWDDDDLIERLAKQFSVENEKVILVNLPGADLLVGARRTPFAYCDADMAEREHAKLQALGKDQAPLGFIEPTDKRTAAPLLHAAEHTAALTVCADDPGRDSATWAALAGTVRPFGLLATIWEEDRPTLKARIACEAAELSYAGHLVTASVSAFDRAVLAAGDLVQTGPGVHGRTLRHVGLWAKYPRSGL